MLSELTRPLRGLGPSEVVRVVIDIAIIYYFVYRTLRLIKGTRAAQMLVGLILIGSGFFASRWLGLATVSWLLDNFINYFIILIIVVFQQDIRRGLVRLGQKISLASRYYEETAVFDEVISAVELLAQKKIGALIVFEREGDLTEFISGGTPIDAKVSKSLLVSMFLPSPQNELHDGAVIIKNFRVQLAGALLPLSMSPRVDPSFGTRHRAALGITEETDAVCLVVSEERGTVSLSFFGNIAPDVDSNTLRKALAGLFLREPKRHVTKKRERDSEERSQAVLDILSDSSTVIRASELSIPTETAPEFPPNESASERSRTSAES